MCAPQERNSHNVQLNPASHGDAAAGIKKNSLKKSSSEQEKVKDIQALEAEVKQKYSHAE